MNINKRILIFLESNRCPMSMVTNMSHTKYYVSVNSKRYHPPSRATQGHLTETFAREQEFDWGRAFDQKIN